MGHVTADLDQEGYRDAGSPPPGPGEYCVHLDAGPDGVDLKFNIEIREPEDR